MIHAMGLGHQGSNASYENVLSSHARFGLNLQEAKHCFDQVKEVVLHWREYAKQVELGQQDQIIINHCFQTLHTALSAK